MLRTTLVAAVLLATAPVLGQTPDALPASDAPPIDIEAEVRRLYTEGAEAADRGQWETARALFEQAFGLKPIPQIAANLGRAELMVGKPCAAADHLEYFLAEEEADAQSRREVQAELDKAITKIGMLRVKVNVDGAEVFIDGIRATISPFTRSICVEPGNYVVQARASGRESAIKEVAIAANSKLDVPLELKPLGSIDNHPKPQRPPPMGEPAWITPALIGGIGLAVVGAGIGIGYSVAANQKNAEVMAEAERLRHLTSRQESICAGLFDPRCDNVVNVGRTRDAYRNTAIAGYLVGGLATLGTVILWNRSKPGASNKQAATTMTVAPSVGGFNLWGTF